MLKTLVNYLSRQLKYIHKGITSQKAIEDHFKIRYRIAVSACIFSLVVQLLEFALFQGLKERE